MKINRNNTALHFLDEKVPFLFNVSRSKNGTEMESRIMAERVKDAFPTLRRRCQGGKVQYISDPFEDAYDHAKNRLTLNMRDDVVKQSGVFIFRVKGGGGRNTIFYSMDSHPAAEGYKMKGSIMCFCNLKHEAHPVLFAAYFADRAGKQVNWFCNDENPKHAGGFELFVDMFMLCLFLRYCQVETKIVNAGRKGEHAGSKYLNETKSDVEIVDSTWFTTIIRTEGFGVKGHFRLQPYPSLNTKKLIYIAPFEKKGYTRKAKVLTQHPENDTEGS